MKRAVAIFLFIVGVYIFGMSYHNIDLAFNARYGALDINAVGYVQDIPTMHMNGLTGLNISAIMMMSAFALLINDKKVSKWRGIAS